MKIIIKVKTNQKHESVKKINDLIVVSVKEAPINGKANEKVIDLLADAYNVPKSKIVITTGQKSNYKIISVNNV